MYIWKIRISKKHSENPRIPRKEIINKYDSQESIRKVKKYNLDCLKLYFII